MLAGHVERHRGLGVVPRVEVVAAEPGYGSAGALHGEQPANRLCGLIGRQDAWEDEEFGPLRTAHAAPCWHRFFGWFGRCGRCGFVAYATKLLP